MPKLFGTEAIAWDTGGSTLSLRLPLQRKRPADGTPAEAVEALDGSAIETWTFGSPLWDAVVLIRLEENRTQLMEMLRAGIHEDQTLRYIPDEGSPGTYDEFIIVRPRARIDEAFQLEEFYPQYPDEWAVELRIRKPDGSDWTYLFD